MNRYFKELGILRQYGDMEYNEAMKLIEAGEISKAIATLRNKPELMDDLSFINDTALHMLAKRISKSDRIHNDIDYDTICDAINLITEVLDVYPSIATLQNSKGNTILHYLANCPNIFDDPERSMISKLTTYSNLQKIIFNHLDSLHIKNKKEGHTPLHNALMSRFSMLADMIIDADPSTIYDQNKAGCDAFSLCIYTDNNEIGNKILDIDTNVVNTKPFGKTNLLASAYGRLNGEMVDKINEIAPMQKEELLNNKSLDFSTTLEMYNYHLEKGNCYKIKNTSENADLQFLQTIKELKEMNQIEK